MYLRDTFTCLYFMPIFTLSNKVCLIILLHIILATTLSDLEIHIGQAWEDVLQYGQEWFWYEGDPSETPLNPNLNKSYSIITPVCLVLALCNLAQRTVVLLPCSVENCERVGQLRKNMDKHDFERYEYKMGFGGMLYIEMAPRFTKQHMTVMITMWSAALSMRT